MRPIGPERVLDVLALGDEGDLRARVTDPAPEGERGLGSFTTKHLEGGRVADWTLPVAVGPTFFVGTQPGGPSLAGGRASLAAPERFEYDVVLAVRPGHLELQDPDATEPGEPAPPSWPTLLLRPDASPFIPLELMADLKRRLPDARLEILPDARHGLPFSHARECARAPRRFLDGVDPG